MADLMDRQAAIERKKGMTELKPCPFCGRIPMVEDCGDNRFFVRCKCGIAQDKLYGQRCDAVRRWNTRKPSAEPQWIFCCEKLPAVSKDVFVLMDDYGSTGVGHLSQDGTWWVDLGDFAHVIAWMPKPDPYEGGGKV